MTPTVARGEDGDPARFVISLILTLALGGWFWSVNAAGTISVRAGPRGSKSTFVADRLTDPDQFQAAQAFIGLLFLVSLAALLSVAWDLVVAYRRDSGLA